jgi:hypothetical protein
MDGIFVLFVVIVVIIAFYRLVSGNAFEVGSKLQKTGQKKIADFKDGDIGKIVAKIAPLGKTLRAPLSGRVCVYYHVQVEQKIAGNRPPIWQTILDEEEAGDVILNDGDHYALIDTELTRTYLVKDVKLESGFKKDPSPALKQYLAKHGVGNYNWLGLNKDLRFKEGVLEKNEVVIVSGLGTWRNREELGLDVPAEKVLHVCAPKPEPLFMSDELSSA